MLALLGQLMMWVAILCSIGMIAFGLRENASTARLQSFAILQMLALIGSFIALLFLFMISDFSIMSVYQNSHTAKPFFYKLSGAWGNHEGSMLLWALISATYAAAFSRHFIKRVPKRFFQMTLAVLGAINLGVIFFCATLSNPFKTMPRPFPTEGQGLNPLLQDVGLAIHPPVLYLGYVGLVIPYGLAIAALLTRMPAKDWSRIVKPWTYIALGFLTSGIILGSWWAYRELGWGGWWFWDPVENASVIPWLIGLALAHSVMALSARGGLGNWSFALAILGFGASVMGTFLVRSGSLVSVHAFAADPGRGIAILLYFAAIVGGGLLVLLLRGVDQKPPQYDLLSRDGALLAHNLFVIAIAFTIFLGTTYPPIIQAFDLPPLAVGAPFYHATVVPFMVVVLVFMAFGPEIPWRKAKAGLTLQNSFVATVTALIAGGIVFACGASPLGILATALSVLVIMLSTRLMTRSAHLKPKSRLPLAISHFGVGIFTLAATITTVFTLEADSALNIGEQYQAGPYMVELTSVSETRGPNYLAAQGIVTVQKNDKPYQTLTPEYRYYPARNMPTTESDIRFNLLRDVRVSMNIIEDQAGAAPVWAIRFHWRPAMLWLWIGTLITTFGLFLAARQSWRDVKIV